VTVLVDTHVILWAAAEPDRLPSEIRERLADADETVYVSSVSVAEMAIKIGIGKLLIPSNPADLCEELGFIPLDLTWTAAAALVNLPRIHNDPFDRLLIAQAIVHDLTLITADAQIARYPDVRLAVI
jgi:PIN domain nuclease of toxin-antitoxin system